MKAVIYARISREGQSEYSIGAQVEECKAYIDKEQYELVNVYTDDGYSAKNMNRPQLQQMLADLKRKQFNMIVIWRLDRLTRDTLDGLNLVRNMFKPMGVEFASVMEDIDTSTPDGFMMYTIRLSMAQNEREKIAERVTMGQMARAKDGKRSTPNRPLGYDVNDDLALTVNEDEADTVRMIFNYYLMGWGYNKISRHLSEIGKPTANGGNWDPARVQQVLSNITYTGAVHWKRKKDTEDKRVIVEGAHESIISREVFDKVQVMRRRKSEGKMNTSTSEYPFSTILKCSVCGLSYYGYSKRGFHYYRCCAKRYEPPCASSEVSGEKLTNLFLDFLDGFTFEREQLNKPITGKEVERDRKRLRRALDEIATKKKNYTRAMGSGKLDYNMYEELIDEENRKAIEYQRELDEINQETPEHQFTRRDTLERVNNLRQGWYSMSGPERKLHVQQLFEVLVIRKDGKDWSIIGYQLA